MQSSDTDIATATARERPGRAASSHDAAEVSGAHSGSDQVSLFRPEVLADLQTQWLGTVLLAPHSSHTLFTGFGVIAAAAIVAMLLFADFTRKARISGWLVPEEGLMRVFAPRPGVVTGLHVAEGTRVRKGEPLVTLSDELRSATLGATQAEIARHLADRRRSLQQELNQQEDLLTDQRRVLSSRRQALDAELAQIASEIALLTSRVGLVERAEARHRDLHAQGLISEAVMQEAEAAKIEQRLRLAALERNRTTIRRERLAVDGELSELPLKVQKEIGTIQRTISQLEQEWAEAEARREIVVPAPQDGTVTAIQTVLGGRADAALPLLSIVPPDAQMEAHLYSPSRAVGFVRPGQTVLLRYEPYPYQRFGHYEGRIASISRSAVSPAELPPQLANLASLAGSQSGAVTEPLYRVTVKLASQSVRAYGQPVPLQPGMLLEADVAIEKRRLYVWVLEPLYTLTGKMR